MSGVGGFLFLLELETECSLHLFLKSRLRRRHIGFRSGFLNLA